MEDDKQVDVLMLMRRWEKQLNALEPFDRQMVLNYLNEKCGK